MARPKLPRPTDGEIQILMTIYRCGQRALTVRQIHEAVGGGAGVNSILKRVQIMEEKGLLFRRSRRPAIYSPAATLAETRDLLLLDLANRAFDGAVAAMGLQAMQLGGRAEARSAKPVPERHPVPVGT